MTFNFKKFFERLESISLSDKMFFTDHLRVMIKAGLPLSTSLSTLAEETRKKRFEYILRSLAESVLRGEQFAIALAAYPKVFSEFFRSMIHVGEISGTLEKNLEQLSLQMHKDHALLSKIRGAMIYPTVILGATIAIVIGLLAYVIPNLVSTFASVGASLPLPTRILIWTSNLITHHGLALITVLTISLTALIIFFRTRGKKIWHGFLLHMLVLGPIIKKINLARFSRTLGALLSTDIPIVGGLEVTSEVLGNVYYKHAVADTAEAVKKGVAISVVLRRNQKLFPALVTTMIDVGEKSGTTNEMLYSIADFYEEQVDQITKNLSTVLEPLLILFLGFIVGGIALAIITPIYSLAEQF